MEEYNFNEALKKSKELRKKIEERSGVDLNDCYQCGKCAAGCPVAFAMDYTPRQIIRLLQIGRAEEALKASSIWLCAACDTCHARCPHGINIPKIMESLRIEADKRGIKPEKTTDLFADLFLKEVENYGRNHEMGMMIKYNLLSKKFLQDAMKSPKLYFTGKIGLMPHKIKNRGAVKKIFENVRARGGNV